MTLKNWALLAGFFLLPLSACQKKSSSPAAQSTAVTDLNALAAAVPTTGPRDSNNYKFFFKLLRSNQSPAEGFSVDAYVKGKSEPKTLLTDANGIVKFEDLPFPDAKHPLVGTLHYNTGKGDDPREITYPFIESDAYRLKDTQYIPNSATAK